MILDAIKTDTVFQVEVKNLNSTRVEIGLGFLKYDNNYSIFINEKIYKIEIIDKNKLDEIDFFFQVKNYTAIINVIEAKRAKYFTMEIIFFSYPIRNLFVPFYVSIDEEILSTARKRKIIKNKDDINNLAKVLKEKISIKINNETYFLVSSGNSTKEEIFQFLTATHVNNIKNLKNQIEKIENNITLNNLEKEEQIKIKKFTIKEEEEYIDKCPQQTVMKELAFSIYGDMIHLPVKKDITEAGDYRFTATKLVSYKNNIKKDSLQLIKADIEFKNGLVSEKIAKDLGNIIENDDSYLKKWDEYSKLEGEILLKKAKAIGELKLLDDPIPTADGYDLKFESIPEELEENDYLSFVDVIPSYIKDDYSWDEYIAQLEQRNTLGLKKETIETFQISRVEHGLVTIKTDKNISKLKNKKNILSIYGDQIQIERKLEARKRLLTGKSANPFLGLIIEDTENIKKYQNNKKAKKIEGLTESIENKIFSNTPTDNQMEAIDIALNTPDIAIIQGPPGTGKTTIVTAIIEILNEQADKTAKTKGDILVTGIQHDAVENIISRLNVNGLPTPKFGKKSTTLVDITSFENVMKWGNEISANVKENLPELSNYQKIKDLEQYFDIYIKTPSQRLAIKLLKHIIFELSTLLNSKTLLYSNELLKSFEQSTVDNVEKLKYIYALRTTMIAFNDDGEKRNEDLLVSSIGQLLNKEEKNILQNVDSDLDAYLIKIQKLKYSLINRLYPRTIFKAEKPNNEIIKLKDDIEKELSMGGTTKDKLSSVLANYINELENNPFALKSLIEEYSFVFSSTTQQSMGKDITKAKKIAKEDSVVYDTVIIDEAARVSPMDLLIVMVQAKRRIILVGDHRQLPHIVDENVIKDSELSEDDFITKSMFGYLKDRAKKLESYDGIKRAITLENQYRTHPLLGKFISENFYDMHKEGFESPLKDVQKYFYQGLKEIENTPAIWIDVKNSECKEEGAWSRECEATKIVDYLRKWIFSEEGKKFDFGIITFYRKQVTLIENKIKQEFSKDERESFKDRLKVGTVDSFQGMEFDIVFLSVVRSKNVKQINSKLMNYNLFGFLISKNRLCVSMSRQKKSLIVVGDREFFNSERSKQDVEELYNFLQLCEDKGKIL